jgi:hypothetical protein
MQTRSRTPPTRAATLKTHRTWFKYLVAQLRNCRGLLTILPSDYTTGSRLKQRQFVKKSLPPLTPPTVDRPRSAVHPPLLAALCYAFSVLFSLLRIFPSVSDISPAVDLKKSIQFSQKVVNLKKRVYDKRSNLTITRASATAGGSAPRPLCHTVNTSTTEAS